MTTATQVEVKEKHLILSNAEVRAILDDRKTQKRIPVKHKLEADMKFAHEDGGGNWIFWSGPVAADMATFTKKAYPSGGGIVCPFGKRGDHLWVREALRCDGRGMYYAADETLIDKDLIPANLKRVAEFCDPFHMPRWASRITLEITNVRAERLQEITNEAAKAEGMPHASPHRHGQQGIDREISPGVVEPDPYARKHDTGFNDCWVCTFKMSWDELNAKRGHTWASNPFVWVIEFKKIWFCLAISSGVKEDEHGN